MKKVAVSIIWFYQVIVSPLVSSLLGVRYKCRYEKTCSQYMKEAILQKGVIIGGYLGIVRILSCQPFTKKTYGKSL